MHNRNRHINGYDFDRLVKSYPKLKEHLVINKSGQQSIHFTNPESVVVFNTALLVHFYGIERWSMPEGHLCPAVPGRADYIHHIAAVLEQDVSSSSTKKITCLDIGTGASLIYPIIGSYEYKWNFIASDVDTHSLKNAKALIDRNKRLKNKIILRQQQDVHSIFKYIIFPSDQIDLTICNPPFFSSLEEANAASRRKNKNLLKLYPKYAERIFQGTQNELWCDGGEKQFITQMIKESYAFKHQCARFSTLVSNQRSLPTCEKALTEIGAKDYSGIVMSHGQKSIHILTWIV